MLRTRWQQWTRWTMPAIALLAMMFPCPTSLAGARGIRGREPAGLPAASAPPAADLLAVRSTVAAGYAHNGHAAMEGRAHIHAPVPSEYAGKAPPPGIWTDPRALSQGQTLYRQDCLACHGEVGDGHGPAADDLPLKPPNFRDQAMVQQMTAGYWLWRVMEGGQEVEPYRSMGSSMPGWKGRLSEEEAWAVIAYVRTFSHPHTTRGVQGRR